jgi:ubiquinone biosynthesis protein UbiJ
MSILQPVKSLEFLVNRVLSMDAEAAAGLNRLAGRTVAVVLTDTRYRLFCSLTGDGVRLFEEPSAEPDVTVAGRPSAFLGFVRGDRTSIDISGDVALAQEIQAVLKRLDLDWEEPLSGWIGDALARRTGNLVRDAARFLSRTRRTLEMDIGEYLRYEKEILPERSEIDAFNTAVDTLRNDAERLKMRIARLQQVLPREP